LLYSRLNCRNASDFLKKLQRCYSLPIQEVQTDKGTEFEGEFDAYLHSQHISSIFSAILAALASTAVLSAT